MLSSCEEICRQINNYKYGITEKCVKNVTAALFLHRFSSTIDDVTKRLSELVDCNVLPCPLGEIDIIPPEVYEDEKRTICITLEIETDVTEPCVNPYLKLA